MTPQPSNVCHKGHNLRNLTSANCLQIDDKIEVHNVVAHSNPSPPYCQKVNNFLKI